MDDPAFPGITYRRGASGVLQPVLRGTGLRVQTILLASRAWQMAAEQIASEYSLSLGQVEACLRFYESHRLPPPRYCKATVPFSNDSAMGLWYNPRVG